MKKNLKVYFAATAVFTLVLIFNACKKDKTESTDITENNWKLISVTSNGNTSEPLDKDPHRGSGAYLLNFVNDTMFWLNTNVNTAGGRYLIPEKGTIQVINYHEFTEIGTSKENTEFNEKLIDAINASNIYQVKGKLLFFKGNNTEVKFERQK